MAGEVQTDLAVGLDTDFLFPSSCELRQPHTVVKAEDIVLQVNHLRAPVVADFNTLADDIVHRTLGMLESTVHLVPLRRVAIATGERTPYRGDHTADGAIAERGVLVVHDAPVRQGELLRQLLGVEVHPTPDFALQNATEISEPIAP